MVYTFVMHPVGVMFLEGLAVILLPAVILGLLSAPRWLFLKLRCKGAFHQWREKNGFEILSQETLRYSRGPFLWGPKEDFSVARIEARDRDGQIRKGFIRCGDHAKGMLGQHEVGVCWDAAVEETAPSARLWLWIGLPVLSFGSVIAAYAYWFAGRHFKPIFSLPVMAPILLAGLVAIGIIVMAAERKRGFPTLRKVVAADGATFRRLYFHQCLACAGGLMFAAGVATIRFLDDHKELPDRAAILGLVLLFVGLGLVTFGILRVETRLRDADHSRPAGRS